MNNKNKKMKTLHEFFMKKSTKPNSGKYLLPILIIIIM